MAVRQNRKHFIVFNNGGVISATTPKDWARAHQGEFANFDFANADNTPTVDQIEDHLVAEHGYSRIDNAEIVIHYPYYHL
jgi:hypothetical protein